jgi:3-oxoacyl-[acyl-carrier-protein] synthase III
MTPLALTGWGTAVPSTVVSNHDLESRLDTTDAWIVERTGIRERRRAGPGETSASMAIEAGAKAIASSGRAPGDIDLVLVATITPAQTLPGNAPFVQHALGTSGGALDVNAACAGFVYALVTASAMLATGAAGAVLVVGSEALTRIVDPTDRATAVLFGDGAAAFVVESSTSDGALLAWDLGCDGSATDILSIPPGRQFLEMDGSEVFRRAVRAVAASTATTLDRAGLSGDDIDLFVPHQANHRIMRAVADRIGIPLARTASNLDRYGNTSAASIPLALAEAAEAGRVDDGDLVLLTGFGAGMTWATALLRWGSR